MLRLCARRHTNRKAQRRGHALGQAFSTSVIQVHTCPSPGAQDVATKGLRAPTIFLNADTFENLWPEEGNKLLLALHHRSLEEKVGRNVGSIHKMSN